ncbi:unnamed protein product, partial [Adineta steineri]
MTSSTFLSKNYLECLTPNEPPVILSIIKYNGRNLLTIPLPSTPAYLMKNLINEFFSKQEIIDLKHGQINERTEKTKGEQPT